ncbi:thiamine phosphate synthase [Marisediminitalea sp.]|jgi:thiamine-phosphate pyrophosphorylase|uniref:thiamine phosphate synthase n=1 Tax=Marisediminitalea sp. TaxID=2662268 RepID=UPI000C96E603|nr:thiamine phosphate synthase [Alteromonadaceae bacterium]HBY39756.1 thiamine phosphate synthase [Alteromonas sp.]|tara:strand:- start:16242 stop:16844 length:603 start_codon:yes stop_codon:yes gene_type:complete
MTKTLSSFYPIFDSADWIERLVPLGIKLVQLRIKDLPEDDIAQHIRRSQAVCRQHNCTLIINDYWQLAMSMGCEWVHLGQEDLDTADIDAIRAAGLRLGISTHDHQELKRALALSPDYVALGPVYPTILKKMKWHEQGLDRVAEWKALVGDVPLVAIGGMSVDRAALAFSAGADIVAAVTDITLHADPELRVKQWLEACS